MPYIMIKCFFFDLPCLQFPTFLTQSMTHLYPQTGQHTSGMPPKRRPDQNLIFYQVEPPRHHRDAIQRTDPHNHPAWKDVFNWTMSYRHDSDFSNYYGVLRKRRNPVARNYTDILSKKTKMGAWIVSNQDSSNNRTDYVHALQSHNVSIDIYGGWGLIRCPRGQEAKCNDIFSTNYKFYFAFENSFCDDYISEKFFKNFNLNLILVARGTKDGRGYANVAPPETYINTADFKSPKELAERLHYLDTHNEEYIAMLKAKDEYFSVYEDYMLPNNYLEHRYEAVTFCQVCQRLWNIDKYSQSIPDIFKWHKQFNTCRDATDLPGLFVD